MAIKLKPLIHYPDSNSVEATWVSQTVIPAVGTEGEEGHVPASVVETQVRCHSYADVQMDMLREDLGADLDQYLELISTVESNIQPSIPVPQPPLVCTPWQFRKALNALGLRQVVEDAIATSTNFDLKDGWQYASSFVENDPVVDAAAALLGKSQEEIHQLFELAVTL